MRVFSGELKDFYLFTETIYCRVSGQFNIPANNSVVALSWLNLVTEDIQRESLIRRYPLESYDRDRSFVFRLDDSFALGCTARNVKDTRGRRGGWVRRTFGNVSYYVSLQPERALNFAQFFPLSVYDRFNLVLFGPFQPVS